MNRSGTQANKKVRSGGTQKGYEDFELGVMQVLSAILYAVGEHDGIDKPELINKFFKALPPSQEASPEESRVYDFMARQFGRRYSAF